MNKKSLIAIALLVVGAILLFVGFNSSQSAADELTEAFTGRYTDQTMFYLIGGAVAAVVGLVMLVRK